MSTTQTGLASCSYCSKKLSHPCGYATEAIGCANYNRERYDEDISQEAAKALLASCREFLPILERQLESLPPLAKSIAMDTARARVERMRAAIAKAAE